MIRAEFWTWCDPHRGDWHRTIESGLRRIADELDGTINGAVAKRSLKIIDRNPGLKVGFLALEDFQKG